MEVEVRKSRKGIREVVKRETERERGRGVRKDRKGSVYEERCLGEENYFKKWGREGGKN